MIPAKTMSPIRSPLPFLDDWFNYVFTYFPTTNWQHAFSPTINFGANAQDIPVEQHVLDQVGSYGHQLNRILDALKVVVKHGKFSAESKHDQEVVEKFLQLAGDADRAAKEFEGEATEDGVRELIQSLRRLQRSDDELDHERYKSLVGELHRAFPQ